MALALLICLATILWCILLTRRQRNGLDKILTGLLGLIAIYDSLRILKDSGFVTFARFRTMEGWVDLISACLYLLAALILKTSSIDRAATKVHLRLVEADEKRVDLSGAVIAAVPELGHPLVDCSPLAIFAIDAHGIVTHWNAAAESLIGWTRSETGGSRASVRFQRPDAGQERQFHRGRRLDVAHSFTAWSAGRHRDRRCRKPRVTGSRSGILCAGQATPRGPQLGSKVNCRGVILPEAHAASHTPHGSPEAANHPTAPPRGCLSRTARSSRRAPD